MAFAKMNARKWWQRFTRDFMKKEFLPIKGLFFIIFGANVSLIPFLTLQARSLGINEEEVGIIYSFIPIASLLAPALSGMLADRIGNFRVLLSFVTALAGVTALLFIAVPPARIIHVMPDQLPVEISCSPDFGSSLQLVAPYECEPEISRDIFQIDIQHCSISCFDIVPKDDSYYNYTKKRNLNCLDDRNCFIEPSSRDSREEDHKLDPLGSGDGVDLEQLNSTAAGRIHAKSIQFSITSSSKINASFSDILYNSDGPICPRMNEMTYHNKMCVTKCFGNTTREHMCMNKVSIQVLNPSLTFYSHLVIRLLKEFTISTSMPLLEGAAVTILKEHKGDFGFQRMFCNLGMMVITPLSGTLIDIYSEKNGMQDFRPAMYLYCFLKLTAAVIILFLNLEFKQASTRILADFSSMLLNPEILIFLMATFMAGICYGYIETFLFWLLEDLGADKQLMSLTITIGSVFGIPLLMVSTFIMKKIGHVNTIILGFLVFIVRLFGYTLISNPWWAMPFEAMECVTVSLMVVSFVSYAATLASPTTVVTLQGLYGGLYNGVGRGVGSLIGGFLIERIGLFKTFRVIAGLAAASGLCYFLVNILFFRKSSKRPVIIVDECDIDNYVLEKTLSTTTIVDMEKEISNSEDKENIKEDKVLKLEQPDKVSIGEIIPGIDNKAFQSEHDV